MKLMLAVMLCAGMARGEDVQAIRWGVSGTNSICPSPIHDVRVSVCMVTNVVESDNNATVFPQFQFYTNWTISEDALYVGHSTADSSGAGMGMGDVCIPNNWPRSQPTERYVTTIITERKTLSFMWDGVTETIVRDREVDRKTKRFNMKWEEVTE